MEVKISRKLGTDSSSFNTTGPKKRYLSEKPVMVMVMVGPQVPKMDDDANVCASEPTYPEPNVETKAGGAETFLRAS